MRKFGIIFVFILLLPQVEAVETGFNGLSEDDWFFTTDYLNITFDGSSSFKGHNILYSDMGIDDEDNLGILSERKMIQMHNQETGIPMGYNMSSVYIGIADYIVYEDDPFENKPYDGLINTYILMTFTGFDPNLKSNQIAEYSQELKNNELVPLLPVNNGTHNLGSILGWNNATSITKTSVHIMYNATSMLNINGHDLEVYTFTVMPEKYVSNITSSSESYYDEDQIVYKNAVTNESGIFEFRESYISGELSTTHLTIINSSMAYEEYNEYTEGLITYTDTTVYERDGIEFVDKTYIRYSPELNFVVQVFGEYEDQEMQDTFSPIFPNAYEVREFSVQAYIPESNVETLTTTESITLITTESTTLTEQGEIETITSLTTIFSNSNISPVNLALLLPAIAVMVYYKKFRK
ncbi:MAG: hypothetical protein INQ03_10595 [Candidatus Heimdallarchaeota archaeon]|nr:hypothetical protein [Candidatus Heimdallarchaeota archaeon]